MNLNHIGTNFDDFLKEEGIMTDNILTEIERIIKENKELKEKIITLETNLRNISMRERLYQSTLQATRTQLLKFADGITTTPHSSDTEYREVVYGEKQ